MSQNYSKISTSELIDIQEAKRRDVLNFFRALPFMTCLVAFVSICMMFYTANLTFDIENILRDQKAYMEEVRVELAKLEGYVKANKPSSSL